MKKLQSLLSRIGKSGGVPTNQIYRAYEERNYEEAFRICSTLTSEQMLNVVRRDDQSLIS